MYLWSAAGEGTVLLPHIPLSLSPPKASLAFLYPRTLSGGEDRALQARTSPHLRVVLPGQRMGISLVFLLVSEGQPHFSLS